MNGNINNSLDSKMDILVETYNVLTQAAPDGYLEIDCNRNFIKVNSAYCKIIGYSEEELLKMSINDIDIIESQEETEQKMKYIIEKGFARFETKQKRKDGKILDIEISSAYSKKQNKIFSFFRDITEYKRIWSENIKKSEEQAWLLKSMMNAFVLFDSVFDKNGFFIIYRFRYIYDAYVRITFVKNDEVFGKTVHEIWPETEKSWIENYGSVAMTGKSLTFDMYHKPTAKYYHCFVYRPEDNNKRFCVIFDDITERKKLEQQLSNQKNFQQSVSLLQVLPTNLIISLLLYQTVHNY